MDKFEIKTAFNRVKYDRKIDHGNMANVNDILYANPMQGVMEQIQDVVHQSDLTHDNFIKECIVSVGINPNALIETAKLNAALQAKLKTLRAEVELWKGRTEAVFAAIPETKREFARKIFEEIYEDCFDQFGYIDYEKLAALKKKYTGGEE
jgi:hypothetical protein